MNEPTQVHTLETAPTAAQPLLKQATAKFGFLPNLLGVLAESPAALEGYLAVADAFAKSSLSPVEQQVVLLAASVENGCDYCVAAHSTVAKMARADDAVIAALRSNQPVPDRQLEALRQFTLTVIQQRGWASKEAVDSFLAAGFTRAQVQEVLTGVTQKTLSNYTNHIFETPLDQAFEAFRWSREEVGATS